MIINQEADEIAYRCAFACQQQGYIWHGKKNSIDLKAKFTKTEIKKFFEQRGKILDQDYTLEPYTIIEEEYIVKYTLDRMVEKLYDLVHEDLGKTTEVNLFLSPSDGSNFRYSVANIPGSKGQGYKAGRPPRPHYLGFVRDRLKKKWGAVEVHGYEADDALGMYQSTDTVASHIDKDINMIPGHHYNHVTGEFYSVPENLGTLEYSAGKLTGRGTIFFYAQLITGDATDNIPGIPKAGPKRAFDLLSPYDNEECCFLEVLNQYKAYYQENAQQAIAEVADLLWIVRADRLTGRQYLASKGFLLKPEVGQFFYDGFNRLSYMIENDYYQAVGFKRPWIYIPESKIFSCSRLATIGDMVKPKDQENEMNTEFSVTLKDGHDTTKGLANLEAQYIEHVYSVSKYNQVRAAKNLGISRGCLRMKLKEYFGDKYL